MKDAKEILVEEIFIFFGFLEGIWFRIALIAEGPVIEDIVEVLKNIEPGYILIPIIFIILSIIVLIITTLRAFEIGGVLALAAIISAFMGGVFFNQLSVILLLIALIIGLYAPDTA
jgi:hypothetical protein